MSCFAGRRVSIEGKYAPSWQSQLIGMENFDFLFVVKSTRILFRLGFYSGLRLKPLHRFHPFRETDYVILDFFPSDEDIQVRELLSQCAHPDIMIRMPMSNQKHLRRGSF